MFAGNFQSATFAIAPKGVIAERDRRGIKCKGNLFFAISCRLWKKNVTLRGFVSVCDRMTG